jgi:hypothetical protein
VNLTAPFSPAELAFLSQKTLRHLAPNAKSVGKK